MPSKAAVWILATIGSIALVYAVATAWEANQVLSQLSRETQAIRKDVQAIKQELAAVLTPDTVKRLVSDEEKAKEISARLARIAENETSMDELEGRAAVGKGDNRSTQKAVYHVDTDDAKTQSSALRNIQNHLNAVGREDVDIQVVLDGGGVTLLARALKDPKLASKVASLKSQGITFNVAANALDSRNLDYRKDLYDVRAADIVPSGIAAIAQLEQQGYAYIKP
jgi:intracellular sulfur oxidation DsrE/DsrF family protein